MDWKTMPAYITRSVDQELLSRNEYLVAENRILRNQIHGRLVSCISGSLPKARGHFVCWRGVATKSYRDISRRRNEASAQKGPRFR